MNVFGTEKYRVVFFIIFDLDTYKIPILNIMFVICQGTVN